MKNIISLFKFIDEHRYFINCTRIETDLNHYIIDKYIPLDNIETIKSLLLTIGNGLYVGDDSNIYTKVDIYKDQLVTFYSGEFTRTPDNDTRLFLDDWHIKINYFNGHKLNFSSDIGAAGYIKSSKDSKDSNVQIEIIDTEFNQLNMKSFKFIDDKSIMDIKEGLFLPGKRTSDRLFVLKATEDINPKTALLLRSVENETWDSLIRGHETKIKNDIIANNHHIYLRDFLHIERLTLKGTVLNNMDMLLTNVRHIKDLLYVLGKELTYKKSNIPKAGNGVFTKVFIKKDQLITSYDGEIVSNNSTTTRYIDKNFSHAKSDGRFFTIIGTKNEDGDDLNLKDIHSLNGLGGGAFLNDAKKGIEIDGKIITNNVDFFFIFNDFSKFNEGNKEDDYKYIDEEYINDIKNHKSETDVKHRIHDKIIVMRALRDISPGDELYVDYGHVYWAKIRELENEAKKNKEKKEEEKKEKKENIMDTSKLLCNICNEPSMYTDCDSLRPVCKNHL